MAILSVESLSFKYPLCEEPAVRDISFELAEGEILLVCGAGGSGKSTLLHCLKREVIPNGELSGRVIIDGRDTAALGVRESACLAGFVTQDCEQQIVTDKVWHELAFGLENLGLGRDEIAVRVAEAAAYFGLNDKLHRDTATLSGGEKQMLALASVMIMDPRILVLDEPCSQLDPVASQSFTQTVARLVRERSLTVIIAEHRLDNILPFADKLLCLDEGRLRFCEPRTKALELIAEDGKLLRAMPAPVRIFHSLDGKGECPCDVTSARRFVTGTFSNAVRSLERQEHKHSDSKALEIKGLCFRYKKDQHDIIKDLDLTVYEGEIFTVLGANGSGKTTMLSLAAGALRAVSGSIRVFGKKIKDYKNGSLYSGTLAMLPQDVTTLFLNNPVREELSDMHITEPPFGLERLLDKHPYDLSGGERQLLALAKVLSLRPKILLLDEPTKSLDAESRERLIGILRELNSEGVTIIAVSHDTEFCADISHRSAVFLSGRLSEPTDTGRLLSKNSFFTTPASLISRRHYEGAVTAEQVTELCRKNLK